jgi:hypothetical protein
MDMIYKNTIEEIKFAIQLQQYHTLIDMDFDWLEKMLDLEIRKNNETTN